VSSFCKPNPDAACAANSGLAKFPVKLNDFVSPGYLAEIVQPVDLLSALPSSGSAPVAVSYDGPEIRSRGVLRNLHRRASL